MADQRAILLLSGGIDSTTLLAGLVNINVRPLCLIFDYGQTLSKEVGYAMRNARHYGCQYKVVDLDLRWTAPRCGLFTGSMAINRTPAQIAASGTPLTYVPFRNGVLLATAVAFGEGHGLDRIYCGGNGLNSGNYWDDTVEFAEAFEKAARCGTAPEYAPKIIFQYADVAKGYIVEIGRALGVDYSKTWSCYTNNPEHCGQCDSCVQRKAALGE